MRVVVTDYIENDLAWECEQFEPYGIELRTHQLKAAPFADLAAATRDAEIIVVNMAPITAELVSGWTRCRLLIRHGIGYDNVDVAALTARGIPLVNVPDYCVEEVAEQAIALFFALARQVVRSRAVLDESSAARRWNFAGLPPLHRIQGQTFGIVGFGRIGARVYQKLSGFGFRWLICDPYLSPARRNELGIETVPLQELLAQADVVTLHAPLTTDTRHLLDEKALALMKPTAFIINTARGGLVDHAALRHALISGRLGGAGLDVFDCEPPDPADPLLALDNVVLTPHLAWSSQEASWDIRRKIVQAVLDCQAGRALTNCLNRDALEAHVAAALQVGPP
jgi:D-3-phosphoglycerate dehydrogenase